MPPRNARRYEAAIEDAGGIDLLILGIGTNGHIGFNEPARGLAARTHRVTLKPETRRSNALLFGGDPEAVPAEALSMGMGTILDARSVVLLATGERKGILRRAGGERADHDRAARLISATASGGRDHARRSSGKDEPNYER